ncbi:hypothetical protein [Persephonella sp. KM09-Lau-8]|uniref:hypothetical protein n=1 Tax=Persephonella sp. KM09-Lau-8 TaxID=1158345 RepID=UPI00049507A7|nr:hypothetical protein [Persephonella sp. KM09-Lau-8]
MKKFIILLLIGVTVVLNSCIDYKSLDTDELEILYEKKKDPQILPVLCEKYYKKYQEEYLKEDYIRNFQNEYKLKTIRYCSLAYNQTKDIKSAKILERLYLSNYVNFHRDFLYFLYWAMKAGDTEVIDIFINNDSKIFAILEHTDRLLDYLTKDMKNLLDEEVIHRFEVTQKMLKEYIKTLKSIKASWLFFTNKDYILDYFQELDNAFGQLISDMKKNRYVIKEVRENFSYYETRRNGRTYAYLRIIENLKALIRINIDDFYSFLGKKASLSKEISTAMEVKEEDKKILTELSPVIKRFIENKNKYLKIYQKKFEEVKQ